MEPQRVFLAAVILAASPAAASILSQNVLKVVGAEGAVQALLTMAVT